MYIFFKSKFERQKGLKIKTALITGITGQDGSYLAKFLLKKKYKVFGTYRRLSTPNFWRLHYLGIFDKVDSIPMDLIDSGSIANVLKKSHPDEFYNLAAQTFVGVSFDHPASTLDTTGVAVTRILEEIKKFNHKIRFYQASSSEMYGNEKSDLKNENTPFHPASPYGIAKLAGHWSSITYRKSYDMYAVNGILFNHESELRGLGFVTRKISNGIAKITLGLTKKLVLGNLSVSRDWGYAPEYLEGMWSMLQQKKPDDYVLATGSSHTVKEFVDKACKIAGVSQSKIISSPKNFRPNDILYLKGDYSKAKKNLGWKPKTTFNKLVKIMIEEDISRWEKRKF